MLLEPSRLLRGLVILLQIGLALTDGGKCRSKFGSFEPDAFNVHACAWCYHYITLSRDVIVHTAMHYLVVVNNHTTFPQLTILIADAENKTLSDRVCKTTNADMCDRWKQCCREATKCCQEQIKAPQRENGSCPQTWDGYGCWEDTRPGTTAYNSCPSFFYYSISTRYSEKRCTEAGSWFSLENIGKNSTNEWTDYRNCLDRQSVLVTIYLGLACNIASVALIIPAIAIFVFHRPLRKQHRIRLHINFFISLGVFNILTVLWNVLVEHGRLMDTGTKNALLFQNGFGCKLFAFLRLYSRSSTYVWMFCEGFYLHQLISNAFKPPKSLVFLYLIGWGFPLAYTSLFGVFQLIHATDSCWVKSIGPLQWILYAPNLGCLVVNFFFLCNILRILLTQLQSHPNEPSNFRRALKATFVLIPLFGVQLFMTMYRLPAGRAGAAEFEKFSVCLLNSQGFFVALIFCFCNGEALSYVKRTCARFKLTRMPTETSRGQVTATSVNFIHHGPDSHESENGNLMFESPRPSPNSGKKIYNAMDSNEKDYQYIPLATRKLLPSPAEI